MMNMIIFIAVGIILMLLLSAAVTFIYIAFYKKTISRRLSGEIMSESGRKK